MAAATSALAALASPGAAQTMRGRVLDDQDDRPVATALVRLVDASGDERAITVADSSGAYRISAPEPGVYRLVAERLGYDPFETPLLEAGDPDGSYPLDLLMRRAPIPIRGIEVSAEQAEREIRLVIGMSPRSLRAAPIHADELRAYVEKGYDLTAMMRWGSFAGMVVRRTTEGPCYEVRGRSCLEVYLNGFRMNPGIVETIPLEMLHAAVVLYPNESIAYPAGAVLLYTEAWLR